MKTEPSAYVRHGTGLHCGSCQCLSSCGPSFPLFFLALHGSCLGFPVVRDGLAQLFIHREVQLAYTAEKFYNVTVFEYLLSIMLAKKLVKILLCFWSVVVFCQVPVLKPMDLMVEVTPRRIFANGHTYHVNSISVNSDCETYMSADDLRINLWHLAITDRSFSILYCDSLVSGDSISGA